MGMSLRGWKVAVRIGLGAAGVYVVAFFVLAVIFGEAGHGPGIEWAWQISRPAADLAGENLAAILLAGCIQYFLLGVAVGWLIRAAWKSPPGRQ